MSDAPGYRRIATEEAFAPPEILARYRALIDAEPSADPGFTSLWGFYLGPSPRATQLVARLTDLGAGRLADMDASGIATQLIFLTAPGVQVFDGATGAALARSSNDQLADAVRRHPARFAGLAAIAPQDPRGAAAELERAVRTLGLKGAVINSHVGGEYLDDPRFWEIFEAAEALDVPLYLHPNALPPAMVRPFLDGGLDGAIYGFAVETGLHMLRIIVSGVFDRFPGLRLVAGHLGEAIPFWLSRIDFMHRAYVAAGRYAHMKPLQRKPSDYVKENFHVTTSGVAWEPAILFTLSVMGSDRVLYAMDYPYQYVPDEVKLIDALPIGDLDKRKLYQLNAERVFGL